MFDTHKEDLLTKVAAERLSDIFRSALQYMDTPRDKQVLKGLISEMTTLTLQLDSKAYRTDEVHEQQNTNSLHS